MNPDSFITVSHPNVNQYVRALVTALGAAGCLRKFHTTLAFGRREIAIPPALVRQHPTRELLRLISLRLGWRMLTAHERGFASVDAVARVFDREVSTSLRDVTGVYCYEDSALKTFQTAASRNIKRFYELPILYWTEVQRLLREEAERYPEWEPTLLATRESFEKLERKSDEVALADLVICPSRQVQESLPAGIKSLVAEYGCPEVFDSPTNRRSGPLRLLFVGSMSQRKGLADLFCALKALNRFDIELIVLGSPLMPMDFYRRECAGFVYEPPRSNAGVRALMASCDVLVLPSIVEGRAMVQMEAMSCGLPIVVTPNAGAEDLIVQGETGFLVPIRAPETLAETLAWIADHRSWVSDARAAVLTKARESGWDRYTGKVLGAVGAGREELEN